MYPREVIALGKILHREFPVRFDLDLESRVTAAMIYGHVIEFVEAADQIGRIVTEFRRRTGDIHENHVEPNMRANFEKPKLFAPYVGMSVLAGSADMRRRHQRAVEGVTPGMVRTANDRLSA